MSLPASPERKSSPELPLRIFLNEFPIKVSELEVPLICSKLSISNVFDPIPGRSLIIRLFSIKLTSKLEINPPFVIPSIQSSL